MKRIKNHNRKETMVVTMEEEAKIVTLLRSPEHCTWKSYYLDVADLITVMVDTGLRQMEALELFYRDVDFPGNMILVRHSKSSPRRVPMTNRVSTILKRRLEAGCDNPFNLSEMQIRIAWTWAKEQLRLTEPERLVLYSLRKTCVQRLIDSGVRIDIIQKWLGYSNFNMRRRLTPLPQEKLTEAAEILERYNLSHHQ